MTSPTAAPLDMDRVLASIDTMAANKPVAAQLVAMTTADDTGARDIADILAGDLPLAGRVMKLANSAYFGMRGRVSSLQFAVTVVGFMTVRTMATVALTDLDDESRLPEDFWLTSTHLAQAAATLAPRFGERPPDALCLGMLAQLGAALLHHNDPEGYGELVERHPAGPGRRRAERQRYGMPALRLTAEALRHWGFPARMVTALDHVDDLAAPEGALLRVAFEIAARLGSDAHVPVPVGPLCAGLLTEEPVRVVLDRVRTEAEKLRSAILG
ncbi:HDOD domain-containing protein [Blastococcus sp. TF02A-26]|uniref:HDOD domain-containing protein n=1 Tax=Blastococcus sp. TF02A-26 TaxID=2250577 RepID=UPI000DEA7CB2|nr:HDOD domain-containing protein [Blastococcus sp. TF02A-26]RBY80757.1 histidine kinase [Blastococcus sp. TF02A-26]